MSQPIPSHQRRQQTGKQGEQAAVAHLQTRGYHIVETNWRCKGGEIDIVARKPADDANAPSERAWVFVEVRTRRQHDEAFASIAGRKAERMIRAAQEYLAQHDLDEAGEPVQWQIDAIAVAHAGTRAGGSPKVEHVENILNW